MTQTQTIEKHLIEKRVITSWEAIQLYRITCLNKAIQLLRKKYFITSTWMHNNKKRFVEYKMEGVK
jgi:hypothetical protein